MRRIQKTVRVAIAAVVLCGYALTDFQIPARADMASAPSLTISQLKITSSNGQFITLYNSTDTALDLSRYQLEYFNSYDVSKSTSSRLITLAGTVPPHGYFMVNDSNLVLCYRLLIDSESLGFSSTAGLLEVLSFGQSAPGTPAIPQLQDYVGWSKTAAAGAQTLPTNTSSFLFRQPLNSDHNPAVNTPGGGSWQTVQPDPANACNLVTVVSSGNGTAVQSGLNQLLPGNEPPATIQYIADADDSGAAAATLPAADIGLSAPKITELLPNPNGTGNDATDEFIELYNANDRPFVLDGFSLQVGLTTLHNFVFPAGSALSAKSFTAFYSADTKLSLSNTNGQVKLLDPFGNAISASDPYATAKDGQAWALANGSWNWTTKPTPGVANIINKPVSTKKTKTSSATKSKTASGAKQASHSSTTGTTLASSGGDDETVGRPVHIRTLVIIGGLAVLYALYEYRTDMANRIYQLKRYLGSRRENRT